MNRFMSKGLGAGILILGLATAPLALPASAQNAESNRPALDTTPLQETKNDFNNFGWLGLIGLIGVVNLFRKRRQSEPQGDPHVGNPSGYRDPDSAHPSSYADPNAVGRSYTDPDDVGNRPERR